jgi:SAM-dependent methyltransferase
MPSVLFATADGRALPVRQGMVDQVWCLGAAAHLGDLDAFGREAARVLRPDGRLVLTEAFWSGRRRPRFRFTAPEPWSPIRAGDAVAALRRTGLEPEVHPWPTGDLPGALDTADPRLRRDLADGTLEPALILGTRAGG